MKLFKARSISLTKKKVKKDFNDYHDKDINNEETMAYSFISENYEKIISEIMQSIYTLSSANTKKLHHRNSLINYF